MGIDDSPLRDRAIFTFGVPRSGTYWLQRILAAHPDVAEVPSETSLFYTGIRPLLGLFHQGARGSHVPGIYIERPELLEATREFCDRVLGTSMRPGARYLAERTSMHVYCVAEIAAIYPDARLVHIIRDGRDVARSLLGREWGPNTVAEAAEQWRSGVKGAREAAPGERYREVRYEALLADPETAISDLYGWLGLDADAEAMAAVVAEARRGLNEDPDDPRLAEGKWRDTFDEADLEEFMAVAGDLLRELGYDSSVGPLPGGATAGRAERAPARLKALRVALARRKGGDDGQIHGPVLLGAQRVVDGALEAIHLGTLERLREYLLPTLYGRVIAGAEETRLDGPDALIDWLEAHPVDSARQLRADPYPGFPSYSLVLGYELDDGSVEDRVLEFTIRDSMIDRLTIYRFPRPAG